MRLDDINAFIDAKRVYERAYRRAFREDRDATVYVPSVSQIREIATLTDTPLKHSTVPEGGTYWSIEYRGARFECFSSKNYEPEPEPFEIEVM